MTEPHQSMKDGLYASASGFGQSALQAYLDRNWPVFLLHGATALELLSKAFLASKHPSLIAAPDIDSLLHACGLSAHAHKSIALMKTITMRDALERSARLIPPIANLMPELGVLIDVRNGVAHLGIHDVGVGQRLLVPFLKASARLIESIGGVPREYWGKMVEIVDIRLSDSLQEAEVRASEAIAAARASFERKYGSIDDASLREALFKSIESRYSPVKYEEHLIECPACSRWALVSGNYEVRWEPDYDYSPDEGSYIAGVYPVVTFFAGHVDCSVCGLELDGEDEVQAAGVDRSWELDSSEVDRKDFEEEEDWGNPSEYMG